MFAFGCAMLSNFLFAARGTYAKICMESKLISSLAFSCGVSRSLALYVLHVPAVTTCSLAEGPKLSGADLFAMNTIFAFVLMVLMEYRDDFTLQPSDRHPSPSSWRDSPPSLASSSSPPARLPWTTWP